MSDDDKSMYFQWICNQCVVTKNKCDGLTQWDLFPLGATLV